MADKQIKDVENSLLNMASDPFGFTDLVDAWNAVFDGEEGENIKPNTFDGVLNETLQTITREGAGDTIGTRVRQMVNALPHMAFVVRSDGLIAAMNDAALSRMAVDPGENVDRIGYLLESGESLTDLIVRSTDRRNSVADVMMKRALHEQSERSATLAIVPSFEDGLARALVFVIDPVWRDEVEAVVSRAYGLTEAELEVLMAFLDGHPLRSIAEQRGRSHTTVRTQFQAIMNKAGARSQAELMRNNMSSVFVYRLGSLIPDRLSRIIDTSTLVPGPYLDGTKTRSPWARALMRAARGSPGM